MAFQAKARRRAGRAAASAATKSQRLPARSLAWFLVLYAAVWLTHWPLLRLPYYWDEAGYYIPSAYDFFRRGALIPYSTLSNAHPPLPSIYLATWWRLFGFSPFVTRTAMCLVASLALAAVYRLAYDFVGDRRAAAATVLLTALYPVWFVQSTLAHADLMAAAGTLWGLAFFLSRKTDLDQLRRPDGEGPSLLPAVVCFALAALAKEIAFATPLALAAWELWLGWRTRARRSGSGSALTRQHLRRAAALLTPVLPLFAWFGYHRARTGFFLGNPEYLRYNATATLSPLRIALALVHRALHLSAHLNLFLPVLITLGCLLLPRLLDAPRYEEAERAGLWVVILANWIFFSMLGGALLTRYLLALYPLVLLLCVSTWRQRLRHWGLLVALTAAAFVLGLFVNPPYRFAPEDTLAYRDSILLQQHAIAEIEHRYGHPTVLTAWPATDALAKPELGYVTQPFPVVAIDNFSYEQMRIAEAKALEEPGRVPGAQEQSQPYTVALLFSTKYEPPGLLLRLEGSLGQRNRALDERFFAFHQDLPPETIARLLGGTVVWEQAEKGQWAAVLHFDRPQLARVDPAQAPGDGRR